MSLPASSDAFARLVATNEGGTRRLRPVELWTDAEGRILDFAPEVETPGDPRLRTEPVKSQGNSAQAHTNGHGNDDVIHADDVPRRPACARQVRRRRRRAARVLVKAPGGEALPLRRRRRPAARSATSSTRARGTIALQARATPTAPQTGTFWGGVFQVRQRKTARA